MDLRQSTEIKVRIGPFLDATDGKTPETGITLGAADQAEILKANGAATVDISAATWAAIAGCDGWYDLTITTSFSDTLGHLTVVVQDVSVCLPVFGEFEVVTANYWDSKCSTDVLQVDVTQWLGTAAAAPTVAGVPEVDVTHWLGTSVTANVAGQPTVDVTRLGAATAPLIDLVDFASSGYDSTNNVVFSDLVYIHGSALTETAGQLAAGFTKLFDVATPLLVASDVMRGTESAALASDLVTAQTDLDTITGTDGVTLATAQALYAPNKVVPDATGTAATLHGTTDGKVDAVQTDATAILLDTGTTIPGTITSLQTDSTAIKAKTDNLPSGIAKNVALSDFEIFMVLSTDHATAATGKTLTGTISKDGGAFAALTNSITEISHGYYKVDLTQAEMNADAINLLFTESDCDDQPYTVYTT